MNRAWAYTINRTLNDTELEMLLKAGKAFVQGWTAHENQLAGSFEIFKKKIIVVRVNEEVMGASGCSIDKLTRFIKETESNMSVQLMDRLLVAYKKGEDVDIVHASKIKEMLQAELISENTTVYNTALANETELNNWEQPLKETWLAKYLVKA